MLKRALLVFTAAVCVLSGATACYGQGPWGEGGAAEKERAATGAGKLSRRCEPLAEGERLAGNEKDSAKKAPAEQEKGCLETANIVPRPSRRSLPWSHAAPGAGSQATLVPTATYAALFPTTPFSPSETQAGSGAPPPTEADSAELAKKLSNPVASLISVPFQNNFDFKMGPNDDGWRYTLNFQPVIPITLNANWNLISRTIVPIIYQNDVVGTSDQTGLGDIVQSFFFSPAKTEPFIWGFGPVLLIPSATNDFLGTEKFGLGPTLVILKQSGHWTYGALWNHIWSVAGKDSRSDVNSTFLQPFLSHTTKTAWTFTVNTESTYDWTGEQWSVPINFQVAKLVRFGKQPVSFAAGPRYWADSPSGGPEGWGLRFAVTLLFPK